ncbi:MAG: hypothetical protein RMK84_19535 [Oscillochloridaceae bacterium]|nr:hypothetical protein [Chloroflexaceae bacterium]MDW8392320.1 hypothetical protein [Oscillochloridaceae bacterium]
MLEYLTRDMFLDLARPAAEGCLSIYLPVGDAGGRAAASRLRQILRGFEEHLDARSGAPAMVANHLRAARELVEELARQTNNHAACVLFAWPDRSVTYRVPGPVPELVVLGQWPHLKPLAPLVTDRAAYYVLSLGKAGVQLFAGNGAALEPRELPGAPSGLDELLQYDDFEPQRQLHPGVPGAGGERGPVFHGHGDAADELKSQIQRYCQQIDRALLRTVPETRTPLVLCGTAYVLAIYRAVSRYPAICDNAIVGSPARLTLTELGARAWEIVRPDPTEERRAARERYEALAARNNHRVAATLRLVLPAAVAGQVDTLLVALDREQWGRYDPQTGEMAFHAKQEIGDDDLLNLAAVLSMQCGATVHAAPAGEVPGDEGCAAILRPGAAPADTVVPVGTGLESA